MTHHHGLTRRTFLAGTAATAAGLGLTLPMRAYARDGQLVTTRDGLVPLANAMHIHTSFSEGAASVGAQLSEAARVGADVLWKTDHDWREMAHAAPTHIGFTSLSGELVAGKPVVWTPQTEGSPTGVACEIVSDPYSKNDTGTPGSLHLRAQGGGGTASQLVYGDFARTRYSQRTNVLGQKLRIDVRTDLSGDSYLEVRIALSNQAATHGRPAGQYQLSYRIGDQRDGYETQSLLGIVSIRVPKRNWTTVTLDPTADIHRLWPDLVAGDNSVNDIWLGATSRNGASAEGWFDNLRFERTAVAPTSVRANEDAIKSAYAQAYPQILTPRGREISFFETHITAYGPGAEYFPDLSHYPGPGTDTPGWSASTGYVANIHQLGGVAGFTHPFGAASDPDLMNVGSFAAALHTVFADLYQFEVCGADILEVGYAQRGGGVKVNGKRVVVDLATHQALWDMLTRNGFYLTANGVSDNHDGGPNNWSDNDNRFLTYTWAAGPNEGAILDAVRAGRVYVGEIDGFSGTIDLRVDDIVPMGAVSVRPDLSRRTLKIMATGVPTGGAVRVVRGPIDYAGPNTSGPGTAIVATLTTDNLRSGSAAVAIDTSSSCHVRVDVLDRTGRVVGFSNPVYLLREPSQRPVPAPRRSPDSAS